MADNNPIKYSDLIKPDNSINDLIDQLEELKGVYESALAKVKKEAEQLSNSLKKVSGATKEGRETIRRASEDAERLSNSQSELTKSLNATTKELNLLKSVQQQQNSISKSAENSNKSLGESYEKLNSDADKLTRSIDDLYTALSDVEKTNYDAFIKRSENGMVSYSDVMNKASSNVSRLTSISDQLNVSFDSGNLSIEDYRAAMERVNAGLQKADSVMNQFQESQKGVYDENGRLQESFYGLDTNVQNLFRNLIELQQEQVNTKSSLKELNKEYDSGKISESEFIERAAALTSAMDGQKDAIKKTQTQIKLLNQLNTSAAGSYEHLSAQYGLNKIALNGMSDEYRKSTEEGRKLVAETDALYQEMKRLQEETGKTSLNVGNYSADAQKLTTQIENQTKQLALLRLEGKQNTEEYQRLSRETGILKDALKDATAEVNNMASDTSNLDAVLGAASAASGGFSAYTGIMELAGVESENVEKAQKKLQAAIAVTTGVQAIQNAVQKQSALMLGISRLQQTALTKAKVYDRLVTIQGTKATISATVAQKAFNLIANANPYVLLATALVTVVGALTLFSMGTKDAAEKQKRLNEYQKAYSDFLDYQSEKSRKQHEERIKAYENELKVAKARNAGIAETRKIEDKMATERRLYNANQRGFWAQEIKDLDTNNDKLDQYHEKLKNLKELKANGWKKTDWDVNLDGDIKTYDIDKAINLAETKIEEYGHKVNIAVNLVTEKNNLDIDDAVRAAQRQLEDKNIAKQETDILRKAEDVRISLIKNSFDQQRAQRKAANVRAIADIKYQLETDSNLTIKARKALNSQIVALQEQLMVDMADISNQQRAAELTAIRLTEDAKIALMEEGAEKQREQLRVEYERQIQDIATRLETERGLTEKQVEELYNQQILLQQQYAKQLDELNDQITIDQLHKDAERTQLRLDAAREGSQEEINLRIQLLQQQRQIELAQNRQLSEDVRQSEADINAKYDTQIVKELKTFEMDKIALNNELAMAEIDALEISEKEKTKLILEETKKRLEAELALETNPDGTLTERGKILSAQLDKVNRDIAKAAKPSNIYELFGLNLTSEQEQAISTAAQYAIDAINSIADAKVQAAERAVEAADREVEAAQNALEAEREARANGYANNVEQAQKELDLAKKNQEKALKEQEKAQKKQEAINSLVQASNLVTASAEIFKSFAGIGPWGIPAAIAMIATMWGAFAAAKIKASQLTKGSEEKYGEGTVELLQGGSHQSGNDIDLGTKPDGTRRRAEGGEFFAVINKRSSRKYRKLIPYVINSFNKDTFAQKYGHIYGDEKIGEFSVMMQNKYIENINNTADLKELKVYVRRIAEQNEKGRTRYIDSDGNHVEVYKNLTRRIRKNW
ncbi:hypothetical protein L0O88_02400 [Bacteroides nordii]|uniref:hypothetical protein n=1 Tax=Bacteroides nordii TaxID=291645 RepID=UPI001EE0F09A|nr:hypothetical protein [Bacteroides nordii]MCG4767932.1 hypothetical protein [Bacteroides nordii]